MQGSVAFDFGSSNCCIGFAGNDNPNKIFSSIIGKNKESNKYIIINKNDSNNDLFDISYPIDNIFSNYNHMEILLEYSYNELNINANDFNCIMSEYLFSPLEIREKLSEILFETFNVPGLDFITKDILSLYAYNRETGFSITMQNNKTNFIIIQDSRIITDSYQCLDIGGNTITNYLQSLLKNRNINISYDIAQKIKEELAFVSLDYNKDIIHNKPIDYKLPDGNIISLNTELFQCTEVLFNPSLILCNNNLNITEMVYNGIMQSDIEFRHNYKNIVLSGQSFLFPNISERIRKESSSILSPFFQPNIFLDPKIQHISTWKGLSLLGSLSSISDIILSKNKYEEEGYYYINKYIHNKYYDIENPVKRSSTKKSARK